MAAEDDQAALLWSEKILFGDQLQDGDFNDRIVRVEKRIFGRRKGGSDEERIERITSTLLIDRKKLKIKKQTEESEKKAQSSETGRVPDKEPAAAAKVPAEPVGQMPATSVNPTVSEPVAPMQPEPAAQNQSAVKQSPENAAPVSAVKSEELQPVEDSAQNAVQKAQESSKSWALKDKGKHVVKRGQHHSVAAQSKTPNQTAVKKSEVTLTPEKAALDSRKAEKCPSVLDTPVTSLSSNRISRGSVANVSKVTELLREGLEAHRKGQDAKAEQLFKRVVLLEPRNPDGYFNLGALAEKKNDLAGALMSYRASLHLSPNDRELREAVDSVESQLGVETTGSTHVGGGSSPPPERETEEARRAEIREYYGRTNDRGDVRREAVAREHSFESSDRFQSQSGEYGFSASAHNGPRPAPNFYRARAKTTREIQEEAAPFVDVTDPDAPQMPVSQPQAPVVSTPQPFQLHSQRNQVTQQATQNRRPSAAGTATRAILGVALSVGTNYALRSAGLHCPVCRIGGGAGPLRYLLRF